MLRRINRALPELILGIIFFGAVVQLVGVWFVTDKLRYSTGLWIGILTAVGMAIHMAVIIEDAVSIQSENGARNKVALHSILRYIIVAVILIGSAMLNLGDVVTLFIGVMGLKAGAYLQPLTHKAIGKVTRR